MLQLWPDDRGLDAFAGGPRRMARSWGTELAAWVSSGWDSMFMAFSEYWPIDAALRRLNEPFTKADVAADWVARTNGTDLEPVQWDEPAASAPRPIERPSQHRRAWLTDFASRKGRTLRTIDDLWDVALAAGMLRPQPPDRFAPAVPTDSLFADGAVPPPVLDELRADWRNQLPYTSEFHSGDIQHLIRWAPDGVLEPHLPGSRRATPLVSTLSSTR